MCLADKYRPLRVELFRQSLTILRLKLIKFSVFSLGISANASPHRNEGILALPPVVSEA